GNRDLALPAGQNRQACLAAGVAELRRLQGLRAWLLRFAVDRGRTPLCANGGQEGQLGRGPGQTRWQSPLADLGRSAWRRDASVGGGGGGGPGHLLYGGWRHRRHAGGRQAHLALSVENAIRA